jgi:type IV fimbrial biogenesis protein FimT
MFQHAGPGSVSCFASAGFTLIELMVCVALCAVLALIAAPSLQR